MAEKELMHDLHEKNEIRRDVEARQKVIDKSGVRDDREVYTAAMDKLKLYKEAYRINLVVPNWKEIAEEMIKKSFWMRSAETKKIYTKYKKGDLSKEYPNNAKRAYIAISDFTRLELDFIVDRNKLWGAGERSIINPKRRFGWTLAWNIWPNLDRIASRINTAEEGVRRKAQKEISQQNTENLATASSMMMNTWKKKTTTDILHPTEYMKRVWDKFVFTKESNPVKIHQVMSAFIQTRPDDVFLLDYNWCIWNDNLKADIKRRTKNNSWKVYIKYNPNIGTYDFFDWTTKEPLWWKRPYIWEWVTMMTKDVEWLVFEQKKQAQLDAATNVDYSKLANDLQKNFPEQIAALKNIQFTRSSSIYDELLRWNWGGKNYPNLLRDFLVSTESRLDEVIKRRRANSRYNRDNPIDTWSWIFKARFVTGNAKTEVPLFVKESGKWAASIPEYLYEYMSGRTSQLKNYITQRFLSKWETLSHMERREQVVDLEGPAQATDEKEKKRLETEIENKKELQLYWVEKLLQIVSNLEQKDENTPEELAEFAYHMEAIKNDILKAPKWKKISDASRQKAVKEAQTLFIKYKSNDWSRATMTDETARKLVSDILNGASRSKIQEAASELWVNMTLFDNTSRAWVVEDIINDWSEANQNYYDKPIQKFEKGIKSTNWITIDGITYKLECHPSGKKFTYTYTETWSNWNIIFQSEVTSETAELPKEWNWKIIRDKINAAREKYLNNEVKWNESPMKINNEEYDKCYQKICQLSYINVDEETWEIWPQANVDFIDKLMACENTVSLGNDERWLDTILLKYWIITKEIKERDDYDYRKLKEKILETIKSKREMEAKFQISKDDMKKRYNAEIEELKRKTTLNDEEMARMAVLMWMIENDDLLEVLAEKQTEMWKKTIRYCGMDDLLNEHITSYLAKNGGWISGTNAEIYNDSNWLRWRWDWTDENCEKIGPILQEILIEVAITAVAIGLWAITGWAWTALVYGVRASTIWLRAANYANKISKARKIINLCRKLWVSRKWKFLTTLKNSRLWRSYARATAQWERVAATAQWVRWESATARFLWRRLATTRWWRLATRSAEWAKWTKLWKEGKKLWDIVKAWNIARTEGSLWMKTVWMIFEWTWFHVASTALHNAINWENLLNGLNPIDNFTWYVQSIAFLWVLKFLWKPINTMTNTSLEFALWERISASQFWGALKYIAWLWWEFWTLCATDQILNVAFEWETKEMTTEDAIHSISMILWLRLHWKFKEKFKEIKKLTIKEYNKAKKELTVDFWEWEVKINENEVFNSEPKHKRTPEQEKLNNQYKRMERQSKYNKEFKQAKDLIKEIPENLRSESMKKFLGAWDMIKLWFHEIKQIQREIGLKWKAVDWILWPKSLKMLRDYVSQKNRSSESVNNRVKDKATELLHKKFDELIMSESWITIDGITYKLERRPNEWLNQNGKWRLVYTETWPDWKIIKENTRSVASESPELPDTGNWNRIRRILEWLKKKYVEKNLNSTLESARDELNWEFTRDIESRSRDLEWKRNDRTSLEWKKKNLSDEIDWLKSRKTQLEQQLQNISKELTIQPDISSLKDIEAVFFPRAWKTVSIGWVKCKFIGIKWDKIIFSEWKWKTREFSSFKELKEAWIKFDIDINVKQEKDRTEKTYDKQKEIFEKLVEKEARTKNANEIIKEYEQLQRQKAQIEQDIHDWFFRENADRLVNKHIWIDGVEYQCTGKNTNNGKTTLDFKQTDWSNHFTISSFEQLKSRWQVNGFWDRYEVIDKETRAAWRDLSKYERENHELLWWENWLFKGGDRYVNQKRQTLQQVDQQLKDSRTNYDNAKLATSPKRVPNPEYERIQKEIEWIDAQLIEKWQELANVERNLWTSDADISRLEQEIANLKSQKDNLSRTERWDDIIDNNWETERWREDIREGIEKPEEMERKLDELLTKTNNWEYENVKLDWVTKAMFEGSVYFEWLSRLFKKNRSFPKKFIKKIWDNFVEMKNKCRETLSEAKKKLVEKWNNFLERKLAEEWDVVEIKEEEINLIENESRINEWNERPDRWINTERREMSEVQRNSDVVAIWDLHWEYQALKWNMEYVWLAREVNGHLEWTGWNKKVVFQWDILADRWTDWLRIIKEIHQLREQARKEWWDIDIIVGNHDDFMISYLTWRNWVHWNGIDISIWEWFWNQGLWITELLKFYKWWWNSQIDALKQGRKNILQNMRNSTEWKLILEEICNMKLVSQVDDVLYCHTNPTSTILKYLTRWWNIQNNINLLNQKYQWFLRKALLWEWNSTITLDEFNNISDIFLHTENRRHWLNDNYAALLRNNWINMISHGHSGGSNGRWYTNNQLEVWWVKVVDTDYSYWKKWRDEWQHSISVVKKEWWVNYIWDNVAYANLEYSIWSEVYVKFERGWESKARIESFDPITKEYTVTIKQWEIEIGTKVKAENLRNISEAEEYLRTMCKEEIDYENVWLTEGEIKNIYSNFEKIKEISWKEKFTLEELDKLWYITENELNNIQSIKNEIWKFIESIDINDRHHVKYINKEKITKLLNNQEIRQKLEYITWKAKRTLSDIRSLSEIENLGNIIDIISNPEIKQKLEQLKWRNISASNLPSLSNTKNLNTKLDNIINNIEKIKELTWRTRLNLHDIDFYNNLTNFTKYDLDRIKAVTKQDPLNIIRDLSHREIFWENNQRINANYTKIEFINDKIFKMTRDNWVDYAVINEYGGDGRRYGEITLQDIWNKTFIFHAWMNNAHAAWRAFEDLANAIPEWYKISETLSLSWDSFQLFLSEFQRKFRTDYIVRATGKKIYLNSQWEFTPESKLIREKSNIPDADIFETTTEADALEVCNAINKLMKDHWQPLNEWQTITELAEAKPVYNPETRKWRVEIPQIEMIKQHNNWVELAQELNKCETYEELTNVLSKNLSIEYHFRDGTLTWQQLLDRCRLYREWKLVAPDEDPRRYFPAEFINPTKWRTAEWTPNWRNTTRKSNIHKLLDS